MNDESSQSDMFAARLRSARDLRKYTQSDLAQKAKLPPSSIAHFEGGKRKPSFDNLRNLANALNVTTDYLLGRTDSPDVNRDADPLFRDVKKLTGADRDLAMDFLGMLAKRDKQKNNDE